MGWWFATAGEGAAQSSGNNSVAEASAQLSLLGGTAHLSVTRIHVAPNLALASGTYTITKYVPVHLDAPNMRLVGGASNFTVVRKHSAALLSLLGGTQVVSVGRYTAEAAAHMSLLGGASFLTVARKLTAANLALAGGNHDHTINIAVLPVSGNRVYTTDENPENLVGSTSRREPVRLSRRTW
jgi:hypothetical protein